MRPLAILLLAALLITGCGRSDDGGDPGAAGGSGASDTPTRPAEVGFQLVAMITVTEGGGHVTDRLTYLDDESALRAYVDTFSSDQLQGELLAAAEGADVPDGQRLAAAVVAVGCTPPTEVLVTGTGDERRITAYGKPSASIQCLAPITTVALVTVDAS